MSLEVFQRLPLEIPLIMTPESPFFYEILQTSTPPGWRESVCSEFSQTFVCDSQTGIMRPSTEQELWDYAEGGEYDEIASQDEEAFLIA